MGGRDEREEEWEGWGDDTEKERMEIGLGKREGDKRGRK